MFQRIGDLTNFVNEKHGGQLRKYTNEPYVTHPIEVALILIERFGYSEDDIYVEVALCHDLLEDTDCTKNELVEELKSIGYNPWDAVSIVSCVMELTDVYTHENFPAINRKQRKRLEGNLLALSSTISQTVKYADILSNTPSITEHDPKFAKVYLSEIDELLSKMDKGDEVMYEACLKQMKILKGKI